MRRLSRMLKIPLRERTVSGEGTRAGRDAERGKTRRTAALPGSKVVDRDSVVEAFSQLRDELDRQLERVNDLVVTIPSLQMQAKALHKNLTDDTIGDLWPEDADDSEG